MALSWQSVDVSSDPFEPEYHGDPLDVFEALSEMLEGRPDWHRQAACRGKGTSAWFPARGESLDEAREVCSGCPVKSECLQAALEVASLFDSGVWGGSSARQRRQLRRTIDEDAA